MADRFIKRPVEVQAMRIDLDTTVHEGETLDRNSFSIASISGWMMGHGFNDFRVEGPAPFGLKIKTLEGWMLARAGWWVIRGVKGEFYPCDPEVFDVSYSPLVDKSELISFGPTAHGMGTIENISPSFTVSDRGFKHLAPITSAYGPLVNVYESSLASAPHIWLSIEDGHNNESAHLSMENVDELIAQLTWLKANHYQNKED